MKFKLKESIGYTYFSDDPELYGYDLELDPEVIYENLIDHYSIKEVADILAQYKYLSQNDIINAYDLNQVVLDCITYNMNIYDVLGIIEFREIIDDYIQDEESQLLMDIKDAESFRSTHGPEI